MDHLPKHLCCASDQASISRKGVGIISARTRSFEAYSSLMVIDVPNLFFQTDCDGFFQEVSILFGGNETIMDGQYYFFVLQERNG